MRIIHCPRTAKNVPAETEFVPAETEFIPAEMEFVPAETEFIPAETKFVPAETEINVENACPLQGSVQCTEAPYIKANSHNNPHNSTLDICLFTLLYHVHRPAARL